MPKKKIKQSTLNFNDFSINKSDINIPSISAKPIVKNKIIEKKTLDSSNNILEVYIYNNENNRKFLELTNLSFNTLRCSSEKYLYFFDLKKSTLPPSGNISLFVSANSLIVSNSSLSVINKNIYQFLQLKRSASKLI